MIKLGEFEYNWQDFLRLSGLFLLTLIGFWNISLLLLPLLIIAVVFIIILMIYPALRHHWLPGFSWIDLGITMILFLEVIDYQLSIYPPNGLPRLEKITAFVLYYYTLRILLQKVNYREIFFTGMGAYAFLLSLGAFFLCLILQTSTRIEGWNDVSQFKRLYSLYGLLNNEWATIALCLLPFPLLAAVYWQKLKIGLIISALAFAVVNVGVLVSFSRGAYLSLGLFWLITISGILYFKLLSIQSLVKTIIILAGLFILFIIPIKTPVFTTLAMNKTVSQQRSAQGRMDIIKNSLCQAEGHLIFGVGSNNYPIINSLCKTPREDQGYSGFTNNTYLQILLEKGLVGLISYAFLFSMIIIFGISMLFRNHNPAERLFLLCLLSGLMTLAFRELFFSTLFYSSGVLLLTAIIMGGILSFQPAKPGNYRGWMLFGAGLIIITCLILYQKNQTRHVTNMVAKSLKFWQLQQKDNAKQELQQVLELAPDVAPYHALQGLLYGQRKENIKDVISGKWADQKAVGQAIKYYQNALSIDPYDAGYHFNLSWLYYWKAESDSTQIFRHLDRVLELEPNAIEYRIGAGLLQEIGFQDTSAAFLHYERALRISPELLDAPFFADLQQRQPERAALLIKTVIQQLKEAVNNNYNTIFAARLSKLLLTNGDTLAAQEMLERVVQELPDLNRPYYYLANITLQSRDTALAISLLNKSILLERTDYLPFLALGELHFARRFAQKAAPRSAIQYYKQAVKNWLNEKTLHSERTAIRYLQAPKVNNDLVINKLMHYCKSKFDINEILTRIAILYQELGQAEQAQYYRSLAAKAPDEILLQEVN
ncbi:MAG: O-antigen ligase family protein [Saprospiraceae bacterium]